MAETVYDVRLRYLMDDKASKGAAVVDKSLSKAAASSMQLDRELRSSARSADMLGRAVRIAAGYFGARAAWAGLVTFNSSMEDAKNQIAGMISLTSGGEIQSSLKQAGLLVTDLQQRAKSSVGTTKDFVDMASQITRPIMSAGLSMKDLGEMTQGAVVASRAFGIAADVAARDVDSALMGQLRSVDQFSKKLLEAKMFGGRFVGEEGRAAFNAMSAADRASTYKQALSNPALLELAKEQGNSFAGVISTLQDNAQMFMGKIGSSLFSSLKTQIGDLNKWIDANQGRLNAFAEDFGKTIASAFSVIKDTISFIIDNRETLMTLAKAFVVFKGISAVGGFIDGKILGDDIGGRIARALAMGGAGEAAGGLRALGNVAKFEAAAALKSFASSASGAATILAGVYTAASYVADGIVNDHGSAIDRRANAAGLEYGGKYAWLQAQQHGYTKKVDTRGPIGMLAKKLGLDSYEQIDADKVARDFNVGSNLAINKIRERGMSLDQARDIASKGNYGGNTDAGAFYRTMANLTLQREEARKKVLAEEMKAARALSLAAFDIVTAARKQLAMTNAAAAIGGNILGGALNNIVTKPQVNVTINKIEVESNDPDRLVRGMGRAFQDAARNPSSAFSSFTEY